MVNRRVDLSTAGRRLVSWLKLTFVSSWYSTNDPTSKDRVRHLTCNYTANIVANLVGGTFWTGLLLLLNADDSFIGTTTMISTSANMLQLLSPLILERFPKRRRLLSTLRGIQYLINILFIGLIPLFPVGHQAKLTILGLSILVVNLIVAFNGPGISIWHIQSIPERVRKNYFSLITMTNSAVVALFNLLGSRAVDWFKARGMEYQGLMALRLFALALGALEIYLYFHITEHPYEQTGQRFTLKDIFTKPLKNKSYRLTVLCPVLWNFAANIPGQYHAVYMLRDVGVSYSYVMLVSTMSIPISFLFAPIWTRILKKLNWFRTLAVAIPLYSLCFFGYAFTSKSTLFMYPISVFIANVMAIGINMSFTGLPYDHIPPKNTTIFIAFYSTMANLGALLGVTTGKYFILGTADRTISILGFDMCNKQYIVAFAGIMLWLATIGVAYVERKKRAEKRADEEETE